MEAMKQWFDWKFFNKSFISIVSVAKLKNIVALPVHMCWKVLPCIMAISAWISIVFTVMKQ
jgi:hypothetical protein